MIKRIAIVIITTRLTIFQCHIMVNDCKSAAFRDFYDSCKACWEGLNLPFFVLFLRFHPGLLPCSPLHLSMHFEKKSLWKKAKKSLLLIHLLSFHWRPYQNTRNSSKVNPTVRHPHHALLHAAGTAAVSHTMLTATWAPFLSIINPPL